MQRRPLVGIALCIMLGIVMGHILPGIPWVVVVISVVAALLMSAVTIGSQRLFYGFFFIALIFFGMLRIYSEAHYAQCDIIHQSLTAKRTRLLAGKVISNPYITTSYWGSRKTVFYVKAQTLFSHGVSKTVSGKVKVVSKNSKVALSYGDEIIIQGTLFLPAPPQEKGEFDYRAYLIRSGVGAVCEVGARDAIVISARPGGPFFIRALFALKNYWYEQLENSLYLTRPGLIQALLLGERGALSYADKEVFRRIGAMHIFSISGLHVGMIMVCILSIMKCFRRGQTERLIIAGIIIISYAIMTGLRPSVIRASIMAVMYLLGKRLYRHVDMWQIVTLSALCIVLFNPYELFQSGFQMSFIAVCSIIFFTPKINLLIEPVLPEKERVRRITLFMHQFPAACRRYRWYVLYARAMRTVSMWCAVSLSAWGGVMPLVLYYFGGISLIGPVSNVIIVPLVFCLLLIGYLFLGVSGVPFFSAASAWLLNSVTALLYQAALLFTSVPGIYYEKNNIHLSVIIAWYICYVFFAVVGVKVYNRWKNNELATI